MDSPRITLQGTKFHRVRKTVQAICVIAFILLPLFNAVRFDIPRQRFYFFGAELWVSEFSIIFFSLMFLMVSRCFPIHSLEKRRMGHGASVAGLAGFIPAVTCGASHNAQDDSQSRFELQTQDTSRLQQSTGAGRADCGRLGR